MTREIKQIKKPGRERPYITIVDTGLAMAAQNFIASLVLRHGEEGNACLDGIVWDEVEEIANRLARELQERTF